MIDTVAIDTVAIDTVAIDTGTLVLAVACNYSRSCFLDRGMFTMRSLRHPLSGAIYEIDADGLVLVTSKEGVAGRFRADGTWVDGALRTCDPHVCVWVGGPQLPSRHEEANLARQRAAAQNGSN